MDTFHTLIGEGSGDIGALQMSLRAALVFAVGLLAVRLAALGGGREASVADYAASAHARRIDGAMVRSVGRDESVARFRARYPADALAVMTDARPDFILSALDAIDRDWGGMAPYLDGIGVTAPVVARLRADSLENMEGQRL